MTFHICKRLISQTFKTHSHLQRPNNYFRLFIAFYSSSIEKPTENTNLIFDLLRKHNLSSQVSSKVASELSYLKNPEKCDSVLSFLEENGFSIAQLEKIVNYKPRVLTANVDKTIKPKIEMFKNMGISSTDTADILSADPWILYRSAVNAVEPSVKVLRALSGSSTQVAKLLRISGTFLKCNLEKTMLPNIELLKSCGVSTPRLVKYIYSFPRFCLHKPDNMKKFVEKADAMGCNRNSKMYLHAIRTLASMSEKSWELKMEIFRDLGFSKEEVVSMFQRRPQVFAISNTKIKKVVHVLLETKKYDRAYVFNHPEVLICSVEKRLKPRLQLIDVLESRHLLKKRPSLSTIYKCSRNMFYKRYVFPHLDKLSEFTTEGACANEIQSLVI